MQARRPQQPSATRCWAPACSKRQRLAAAAASSSRTSTAAAAFAARQQQQAAAARRRRQQPAASGSGRRGVRASAAPGDLGDEFEEMVERRDELLRIREDAELNTDEDEELAALTDRKLLGYRARENWHRPWLLVRVADSWDELEFHASQMRHAAAAAHNWALAVQPPARLQPGPRQTDGGAGPRGAALACRLAQVWLLGELRAG